MKKILGILMIGCLSFSYLQASEPSGDMPKPPKSEKRMEMKEKFDKMTLEEAKAEILSKSNDRKERIAEVDTCVEKATSKEALRECLPKREMHGEKR